MPSKLGEGVASIGFRVCVYSPSSQIIPIKWLKPMYGIYRGLCATVLEKWQ